MFGSAFKFLSNLSYIPFDEISFLKLILDSAELEYIVRKFSFTAGHC